MFFKSTHGVDLYFRFMMESFISGIRRLNYRIINVQNLLNAMSRFQRSKTSFLSFCIYSLNSLARFVIYHALKSNFACLPFLFLTLNRHTIFISISTSENLKWSYIANNVISNYLIIWIYFKNLNHFYGIIL